MIQERIDGFCNLAGWVAVPDETWGEVGCAFIVKGVDSHLDEAEILDFLRGRVAKYKLPKQIIFLEELPKTAI